MAEKDLEGFTSNDDWLARELKREKQVSFWDLDEGKKVRQEHEENCEADDLAREHKADHNRGQSRFLLIGSTEETRKPAARGQGDVKWFIILFFTTMLLFLLNSFLPFGGDGMIAPGLVCFLAINPGIFFWLILAKRFPPKWYSRTVFYVALLLEAVLLVTRYRFVILHLLRRFFG